MNHLRYKLTHHTSPKESLGKWKLAKQAEQIESCIVCSMSKKISDERWIKRGTANEAIGARSSYDIEDVIYEDQTALSRLH